MLLLDKPVGISSNRALQVAKRLFRAAKAGHAGTLDPLASGLLPVLLGEATKFSGYLLDAPKGYDATLRLGIRTSTADAEGEVLETRPVEVDDEKLTGALRRFIGPQTQVPPMYSALKREGTPLYKLARKGENVERTPRPIEIHRLELLGFEGDLVRLRIACSKGTYVRTLAEDLGEALGCGAHLAALRRTATGPFSIDEAVSVEKLESMPEEQRDRLLAPPDALLGQFPEMRLETAAGRGFLHGQPVTVPETTAGVHRVYGPSGQFLGLGEADGRGGLVPRRVLAQSNEAAPSG